jgi:hypothetical protein
MNVVEVLRLLEGFSFASNTEAILQQGVEQVLEGVPYDREKVLSPRDRIEFYLPGPKVGIECKIDGSANTVMRQLLRYTESPLIDCLILVTSRTKHKVIPSILGGKKVYVLLTRAF